MCNLSEGIFERGIEKGKAEGKAEGRAGGKAEGMELAMRIWKMLTAKKSVEDIAKETKISLDEVRKIAQEFGIAY